MEEGDPDRGSWADAVSEASDHVVERHDAEKQAAERQKPRSQGLKIGGALVVLVGVIAWNVQALTSPPDTADDLDERVHLTWFIADAVEMVEDFEMDEGRLPSPTEAQDLLEDDIGYAIRGENYVISVAGDQITLEYDSANPFDEWLAVEVGETPGRADLPGDGS